VKSPAKPLAKWIPNGSPIKKLGIIELKQFRKLLQKQNMKIISLDSLEIKQPKFRMPSEPNLGGFKEMSKYLK
jgi:hypothetical protein